MGSGLETQTILDSGLETYAILGSELETQAILDFGLRIRDTGNIGLRIRDTANIGLRIRHRTKTNKTKITTQKNKMMGSTEGSTQVPAKVEQFLFLIRHR